MAHLIKNPFDLEADLLFNGVFDTLTAGEFDGALGVVDFDFFELEVPKLVRFIAFMYEFVALENRLHLQSIVNALIELSRRALVLPIARRDTRQINGLFVALVAC